VKLDQMMREPRSRKVAKTIGICIGVILELVVSVIIPGSHYIVELLVSLAIGILGGVAIPGLRGKTRGYGKPILV